jgi:hypothetical protein
MREHPKFLTTGAFGTSTTGSVVIEPGSSLPPTALCPDMLRYENIGAADGLRGHVVRGFFWLMRAWKP